MKVKRLVFILMLSLWGVSFMALWAADTYGEVLAWTKLGASTRAFGMGGAYASIAEGPDAVFYNPAGLAQSEKREFTSMYSIMKLDQKINWVSYLHPLKKGQVIAGSWLRYYMDKIEQRNNSGNLIGYFDNTENIFSIAYGIKASSHFYLGVNFNYLEHELAGYSADTFGLDAGFLYFLDRFRVGGIIKNMGAEYEWNNVNKTKEDIPLTGIFGISYQPIKYLTLTADVEKKTDIKPIYRAGVEYWFYGNTALRLGVNDGDLTWGASFRMHNWNFDYGYQDGDLGELHRVSVTMIFE